jgi:Ca-activated chloride channel family protein
MLTFAHGWLFLLLPLPLLVRWLLPPFHTARPAVRLPFFQQVAELTGRRPEAGAAIQHRSAVQGIGYVVVWGALVTALARPQWLEPPIVRAIPTRDLLLAVDLSGSMAAEDFTGKDGQKVDRLTAAKEVLDEFLTRRKGDRVGLIVFGNAAFVQVPFTEDLDVCRQLLAETVPRMAGPKTAFGDAIGLGITLFERSAVKRRVMIALTDGNDTGSQVPPAEAAQIAQDKGIVIHTVAMGDPATIGEDKLDEEALRAVAQTTGGRYFFAADRTSLESIYGTLDQVETRQVETISHRPRRDLFHWPLGFATVLSFIYPLASSALGALRGRRRGSTAPQETAV